MTLAQTVVKIPKDRRVHLNLDFEVPLEIPTGTTAHFNVVWFPQPKPKKEKFDLDASLKRIWELCKDEPGSVDDFLVERRKDLEMEERKLFGEYAAESTPEYGGSN